MFPFYVIVCVTFGKLNPITQVPVPVYSPARWNPAIFSFVWSNLTHANGLYEAPLVRTFVYVGIATSVCFVIGYPFAYFMARHAGRFKGVFLTLFFAPFWISYMLRMLSWISLLEDNGYVNRILTSIGVLNHPYPFLDGKPSTVIIGLAYGYVPFMVLPLYATLDRIHPSFLEAGRDLGGSPLKTFLRVTLPLSRQAILAGFVICSLPMFGDYFTQQLLADTANTRMIGNAIVDSLVQPIFVSRGAALILVLIVLLLVPILYYLRSTNRAAEQGIA